MADETASAPEQTAEEPQSTEKEAHEKQAVGDAVKDIVDKVAPPAEKRKFKVKIDKDELEVDEDELVRGYQLRRASDARFKAASEKAKWVEDMIELAKTNPRKVLSHPEIGVDLRKFAEEILAEQLEEEMLDPKDKEIKKLQREKKEREDKLREIEEGQRKERESRQIEEYRTNYEKEIHEAITTSGLPYNKATVNKVRDYMLEALENGYEVPAKDVISYVKEDFTNEVKELFGASAADVIASLLGEAKLKEVREWDMNRLKSPTKPVDKDKQPPAADRNADGTFKKTEKVSDYFEKLREKFKDAK